MMKITDFERLNVLSERVINETATTKELQELKALLDEWNASVNRQSMDEISPSLLKLI